MKYLLDTSTCVQYLQHKAATPVAVKLASAVPTDVALCCLVLGE